MVVVLGRQKGCVGWWDRSRYPDNIYKRRTRKDIEAFCGHPALRHYIDKSPNDVVEAAIIASFLFGGRGMETLSLMEYQIEERPGYILVNAMKVLKQYTAIEISTELEEEYYGEKVERMKCEPGTRQVPVYYTKEMTPIMTLFMMFVERVRNKDRGLPRRYRQRKYEGRIFPYKYGWLYKWVTATDPTWWPHRFRAERASHLASRHNFGVKTLMRWFGWSSIDVALEYIHLNVGDLVRLMAQGEL